MFSCPKSTSKNLNLIIHNDNQAGMKRALNDRSINQTEHIDIKYHIFRGHVFAKYVSIEFCPTLEMNADVLTKCFFRILFER